MKFIGLGRVGRALIRNAKPSFHRFKKFLSHRQIYMKAPYSLDVYEQLLALIRESHQDQLCDFDNVNKSKGKRKWYVRHDLDESDCISRASELIRLDLKYGVRPGVFLRVKSDVYNLDDANALMAEFLDEGVVFGLHSECYLSDDWLSSLREEIEVYKTTFNTTPFAVNAHGHGEYRLNIRQQFYRGLTSELLNQLGIKLNDCGVGNRLYQYTIEDCHRPFTSSPLNKIEPYGRCILTDFKILPPPDYVSQGLILTHPCYWITGNNRFD
jgi:hypothetical protein